MKHRNTPAFSLLATAVLSLSMFADQKEKKEPPKELPKPSYELPQPEKETLDYTMYGSIRNEALHHSKIMEYASALMDGIGPRLTGSPNLKKANEWARDQLKAMGCANEEDRGFRRVEEMCAARPLQPERFETKTMQEIADSITEEPE